MKTVTQYKEDIRKLMKSADDIEARATSENRDLKAEEISMTNEILDKVEELEIKILAAERKESVAGRLEQPQSTKTVEGPKSKYEVGVDNRSKDRFSSLGQQISCIAKAGMPGGSIDPRLYNAASGLNETVSSEGDSWFSLISHRNF